MKGLAVGFAVVLLLSGCATKHGSGMGHGEAPGAPKPSVMDLPVCGFESPYLPEPCRMQVQPGEWLAIRNPKPEPTRHHGWLWWALVGVIL